MNAADKLLLLKQFGSEHKSSLLTCQSQCCNSSGSCMLELEGCNVGYLSKASKRRPIYARHQPWAVISSRMPSIITHVHMQYPILPIFRMFSIILRFTCKYYPILPIFRMFSIILRFTCITLCCQYSECSRASQMLPSVTLLPIFRTQDKEGASLHNTVHVDGYLLAFDP
jgi:hypothetical protein